MGKEASAARGRVTDMLRRGDFDGAFEAGIVDIRAGCGSRYDSAIAEARGYFPAWRRMATAPTEGAAPTTGSPSARGQADVTLLVHRLTHYLETLDRHNVAIQQAYDQACDSLANLRRMWGGEAAQEFYTRFGSSIQAMERYLDGSRQIREVLEERLAALRQADRPGAYAASSSAGDGGADRTATCLYVAEQLRRQPALRRLIPP